MVGQQVPAVRLGWGEEDQLVMRINRPERDNTKRQIGRERLAPAMGKRHIVFIHSLVHIFQKETVNGPEKVVTPIDGHVNVNIHRELTGGPSPPHAL